MSTAHINAKPEDFAKTVLMPGDPRRSEFIANYYLDKAVLINDVRGIAGYTGLYKGERISVMASGMGMPSIGIYSHELFNFFGVECIIRIGSAGAVNEKVGLGDIVMAQSASTDSNYQEHLKTGGALAPCADFDTLQKAHSIALKSNVNVHVGNVLTSDVFYGSDLLSWQRAGILAVEMETAALYINAALSGKKALGIFTVTDCPLREEREYTASEREQGLTKMIDIALKTGV